ncbi:hypothetical protein [Bowmanella denitrificans]|uniref:hypothetical protein n=1 Tax=Bowmanella denitrificans TaxID=366582 RepID=UPI000C9C6699|nr:hypothetical protein [Bowmanella denitrificans]
MPLNAKEEYILFKLQAAAYGTDEALTGLNAIAVYDINYNPEFTREQLQEALGFPGAAGEQTVAGYQAITFKFYARGAADGQPATPVPHAPLLRAAGLSETVTPDTNVAYAPVSEAFEHGTLYYYAGGANGVLHKLTGVRISGLKYVSKPGALDYYECTAMGLDVDPEPAGALPAVDWSGLTAPLPTAANTVETMTLFGNPVGMASLEVTFGNVFSHLHVTNQEEIAFEERNGSISISIVEPDPSAINYWTKAKKGESGALNYQRGKTASHGGNIHLLAIPNAQLGQVSRRNDAGRLYLDLTLTIKPLTKNSDFTLTTL